MFKECEAMANTFKFSFTTNYTKFGQWIRDNVKGDGDGLKTDRTTTARGYSVDPIKLKLKLEAAKIYDQDITWEASDEAF